MKPRECHRAVDYDLNVSGAPTLFCGSGAKGPHFHNVRVFGTALRHDEVGFLCISVPVRLKLSPDITKFLRGDPFCTCPQLLQDGLNVLLSYISRDPEIIKLDPEIAAHVGNGRIGRSDICEKTIQITRAIPPRRRGAMIMFPALRDLDGRLCQNLIAML
jgi:hypothetical protein